MQITSTKKIFSNRIAIREALATKLKSTRNFVKSQNAPQQLKDAMRERARKTAKAFRNSQKKYGVHEAEVRLSLSQAIRARNAKIKAEKEFAKAISTLKK